MNDKKLFKFTIDILKKEEGFRSKPYLCQKNKWTIFYGRNFEDNPFSLMETIYILRELDFGTDPKVIGEWLLEKHVVEIDRILVLRYEYYFDLPIAVKSALIQMCYQMGNYILIKFPKTMAYCRDRNFEKMADEMLDSDWYRYDTPERAKRVSDLVRNWRDHE